MGTVKADDIQNSAGTGSPTFSNGLITWETKELSSDITSDQTMSDLSFTLTSGRTYRITLVGLFSTNASDSTVRISMQDNASEIGKLQSAEGSGSTSQTSSISLVYRMTSTALTFVSQSASANGVINGNGTTAETHVTVEDLGPTHGAEGTVS